jgi:polar amino acid transport system substrate-binding protein
VSAFALSDASTIVSQLRSAALEPARRRTDHFFVLVAVSRSIREPANEEEHMIIPSRYLVVLAAATFAALPDGRVSTVGAPTPQALQTLAPTGKLRVGVYPGSPTSMIRDPASGETKGLTFDLGKEFARRLNVAFEPVEFPQIADVLDALRRGNVDFTVTNATPARAKDADFTAPILGIELGYLVLSGSSISTFVDVDRPGIRVGVTAGGSSHTALSREFKHAEVVPAPTLKIAVEMLAERKVDAYATNKAILFEMSEESPGSRVLDGRWGVELFAMAIPKGREHALADVRKFAGEAKSEGLVKRAVDRAGLRGTVNIE